LLADLRFRTPRADRAHNYLYVRLNNCGEPPVRDAANLLHDLRSRRNLADYDVRSAFRLHEAATAVSDAADVIRILNALTTAERTRVTNAMKTYEQQIGDVTWQP
jgi:hypothetical protein